MHVASLAPVHCFKADENLVGNGKKPPAAYFDIDDVLRIARQAKVDGMHPGYGFLSEHPGRCSGGH